MGQREYAYLPYGRCSNAIKVSSRETLSHLDADRCRQRRLARQFLHRQRPPAGRRPAALVTCASALLRGGLRDGIDLIEVDNGVLSYSILPTRGMGLLRGNYHGIDLGWKAPMHGPVHPRHVNTADRGGIGWLAGFDEWLMPLRPRLQRPARRGRLHRSARPDPPRSVEPARPHRQSARLLCRGARRPRSAVTN